MAMRFFPLTSAQQSAARSIYDYFFGFATQQGADTATARQFANIGVGVASGEGLGKSNPWSSNPDTGGTALGPFQLYHSAGSSGGGLFALLGGDTSPNNQLNVAASTIWNGAASTYNTGPWNAVGDTPGAGGNNTVAGQTAAETIGQQFADRYGFGGSASTSGGGNYSPPIGSPGDVTGGQGVTQLPGTDQQAYASQSPTGGDLSSGGSGGLPGPLGQILGQNRGLLNPSPVQNSSSQGQIVNGLWEQTGSQATTVAGEAQAKAYLQGSRAVAQATTEAAAQTAKVSAADTAALTKTTTTVSQGWLDNIRSWIVRIFTGGAGLVLLAGAVLYFSRSAGQSGAPAYAR